MIIELVQRLRRNYEPWSVFNYLTAMRKILRHMDRQLDTQLEELVPRIPKPAPRQTIIEPDELARLLAPATPHMRLFVLLVSGMGLRFSEALRTAPEHYDAQTQTITIPTKGGKRRTFPVPDEIAAILALVPDTEGTFLERLRGAPRLSHENLRRQWNQLKRKAGIRPEITPHDLRRTAAVRIYRQTHDVYAAKALLGHDALASTAHYLSAHEPQAMQILQDQLRRWSSKGERVQ